MAILLAAGLLGAGFFLGMHEEGTSVGTLNQIHREVNKSATSPPRDLKPPTIMVERIADPSSSTYRSLTVKAIHGESEPLEGARVLVGASRTRLLQRDEGSARTTDMFGHAVFLDEHREWPGLLWILVDKNGFSPVLASLQTDHQEIEITVRLSAPRSVCIEVADTAGRPVSGADVLLVAPWGYEAEAVAPNHVVATNLLPRGKTDAAGIVRFPVALEESFRMVVSAWGFKTENSFLFATDAEKGVARVTLRPIVAAGVMLEDPDGNPTILSDSDYICRFSTRDSVLAPYDVGGLDTPRRCLAAELQGRLKVAGTLAFCFATLAAPTVLPRSVQGQVGLHSGGLKQTNLQVMPICDFRAQDLSAIALPWRNEELCEIEVRFAGPIDCKNLAEFEWGLVGMGSTLGRYTAEGGDSFVFWVPAGEYRLQGFNQILRGEFFRATEVVATPGTKAIVEVFLLKVSGVRVQAIDEYGDPLRSWDLELGVTTRSYAKTFFRPEDIDASGARTVVPVIPGHLEISVLAFGFEPVRQVIELGDGEVRAMTILTKRIEEPLVPFVR